MDSWWDTNKDGHLDAIEIDRYLLDNGLMPGQPDGYWYEEKEESGDDTWADSYSKPKEKDARADLGKSPYDEWTYNDETDYEKGINRNKHRCYDCLFWRDDYEDWTRDYGCRIFYSYIDGKYPGMDGTTTADVDGETCKKFEPRNNRTVSCLDCKHFTAEEWMVEKEGWINLVGLYCDIWDRVEDTAADTMYQDLDKNITFTMICPKIKLRKKGNRSSHACW